MILRKALPPLTRRIMTIDLPRFSERCCILAIGDGITAGVTYALPKQSQKAGAGGSSVPRKNRAHTYDKDGKGSELIPSIPVGADGPATDAKLEKLERKPYSKELLRLLRSMPGGGGAGGGGGGGGGGDGGARGGGGGI